MVGERGYQVVDPGLASAELGLDPDTQVRILSTLIRRARESHPIPHEIQAEVIPVQYLGRPYPGIGLYTEPGVATDDELADLALWLAAHLETFVREQGVERILDLSSAEPLRWQDVLKSVGRATL